MYNECLKCMWIVNLLRKYSRNSYEAKLIFRKFWQLFCNLSGDTSHNMTVYKTEQYCNQFWHIYPMLVPEPEIIRRNKPIGTGGLSLPWHHFLQTLLSESQSTYKIFVEDASAINDDFMIDWTLQNEGRNRLLNLNIQLIPRVIILIFNRWMFSNHVANLASHTVH